jgi:two-component system, OmpR family, phosphate regulon sensor histidine kinase PhoR
MLNDRPEKLLLFFISKMKNVKGLWLLMVLTILVITGFQAYWLKTNYDKENRQLSFRTNVAFRETIRELQAKKFDFGNEINDSLPTRKTMKIEIEGFPDDPPPMRMRQKENFVNLVNVLRQKTKPPTNDSNSKKENIIIAMDQTNSFISTDSGHKKFNFNVKTNHRMDGGFIKLLYGADSLQDSIRVKEIDSAYRIALKEENIKIPFTINRLDSLIEEDLPRHEFNKMTVGFANPVTYELNVGNRFPYIMKKMLSPILFSLFLVGVTILSFVLLYRNMLKQKRLTVLKNDFISNITHELKTPIATVGVAIEALRNFNAINDPLRTKEYLDISQNELQRLSLLVDKVLKLSMFENKEVQLKYESFNVKNIIDEVTGSMKLQMEKQGAVCDVITEGTDFTIAADKLHITSVVYNLVDNALKYSPASPLIKILLKDDGDKITLSVADNGIGIAPEYKDKVFDKFFRVPAGDTHNVKGYGLGLSYVSYIIEKHNGKITVESEPGKGSTFTITLPKNVNS